MCGNLQAAIDEAQAVSEHAQAEELERQAGLLDDAVSRYYQTFKEKEYVDELKKRYEVIVFNDVLDTLK